MPESLTQLDEERLFSRIKKDFNDSLSALSTYHAEWREYDEFYMGQHWKVQRPDWRPNPVINYISYIIDQKAPQITQSRPSGILYPTHPDDEEAARVFTQATEVVADRCNLDQIVDEVVRTGLLLDISWMKVYWDNKLSGGSFEKMNQYQGDVVIETVDPTNLYFDPAATRVEDCNFMIYAIVKSTEWIKEYWGVEIPPEQTSETDVYNRPILNNNTTKKATFYEYWYREDGTINVIYAAGNRILKHIRNVYKHGRYPFVPFVAKKNRKSILGISECRNLLGNQKLLNKLVEIPVVNSLLVSNPIMLINSSSGIDANKVTSKPGQIWTVRDDGTGVRYLNPPVLGGEVFKMIDQMTQFMERIGGVYDANTGETPGGVTAASAIQLLQEQGSIPLKGITRNLYSTLKEVYEQMVELIKEFYTETRYLRVTGKDGKMEFMEFNALRYKAIDFDIRVSAGASTPTSKAFIAQLGLDLFSQGLLLPSEYVDMLENLPNKEKIVERLRQKESSEMAQPPMQEPPQPTPGQSPEPEQQQMPSLGEIYQRAPQELRDQIDLLSEQGLGEQEILQILLGGGQGGL
jgi:hypothetical protein